MIDGISIAVDDDAVIVVAREPLTAVSSAAVGGGFTRARAIVNMHVEKDFPLEDLDARLGAFARRRELPGPWIGLFTGAWTAQATLGEESAGDIRAIAVSTAGLSNLVAAGISAPARAAVGTINTIVVVDAVVDAAALVNTVMTVTEVKVAALIASGRRCGDGASPTGTSTDAVVVAATGRGRRCGFGGPVSDLGWVVARAARASLETGIAQWPGART